MPPGMGLAAGLPAGHAARDATAGCGTDGDQLDGIAALFKNPSPSMAPCPPPPPRPRQRGNNDTTTTRRSARLAAKPRMPVAEMAQRNLWRKLGINPGDDPATPIEKVLKDVVGLFTGPLPPYIIGAMTTIFDFDNDEAEEINDTLMQYAGEAVDDLQEEATAAGQ